MYSLAAKIAPTMDGVGIPIPLGQWGGSLGCSSDLPVEGAMSTPKGKQKEGATEVGL